MNTLSWLKKKINEFDILPKKETPSFNKKEDRFFLCYNGHLDHSSNSWSTEGRKQYGCSACNVSMIEVYPILESIWNIRPWGPGEVGKAIFVIQESADIFYRYRCTVLKLEMGGEWRIEAPSCRPEPNYPPKVLHRNDIEWPPVLIEKRKKQ
jgi:hypothetical protein